MRIALISDTHGNLVSLDAVLADINRQNVDQILCLGDVAALGPQPHEVVARLRALDCPCVMGNHDFELLDVDAAMEHIDGPPSLVASMVEWLEWCASQLSEADFKYLRSFEPLIEIPLDTRTNLLCFHGSPRSNTEFLSAATPVVELEKMLTGYAATVMAGGHTHVQMLRRHNDVLIVNTGSVGLPFEQFPFKVPRHMPWAEYAIVSQVNGVLSVDLRRVAIDVDAVIRTALTSNMPSADDWVKGWMALQEGTEPGRCDS